MGFLDDLKDKAEDFGAKAKEGLGTAKDKASDVIDDVKDRFDKDEDTSADKVEQALNYDPDAVDKASETGIAEAAASVDPTLEPAPDAAADAGPDAAGGPVGADRSSGRGVRGGG